MNTENREAQEEYPTRPSRRLFLRRATQGGMATLAGAALIPGLARAQGVTPGTTPTPSGTPAGPSAGDLDILNFALTLERLEAMFYNLNGDKPYLGSGTLKAIVAEIRDHENAHVALLQGALGANAQPAPTFQGLDAPTLTQFLTMAQTFEDVGVSAYLGQAPLIQDKGILATASAILDIEARHAGGIREYRKTAPSAGNPAEGGDATITLTEDREAVNRARSKAEVLALVAPFIAGTAAPLAHDLAITAVEVGGSVSASADANVFVTLQNRGTADESYHIFLRYGSTQTLINDYIDTIPAGQTKRIQFIWPKFQIGSAGTQTLRVEVITSTASLVATQSVTVTA